MKNPKTKTKVVHSDTKPAWNVVATSIGGKYKIARIPYLIDYDVNFNAKWKQEALDHAEFISHCFNNSDSICPKE